MLPTNFGTVQASDFYGIFPGHIGGVTWYVNNATSGIQEEAIGGSDGNSGRSPQEPFATIQRAVNLAVSGRGDKIVVYPGTYAENVVIDQKDYLTIHGAIIPGYARPDIVPATGIAINSTRSQGLVLSHVRVASSNNSDTMVHQGNGFIFSDCVFDGNGAQAITAANLRLVGNATLTAYTASEGKILNSLFRDGGGVGLVFQHAAAPNGTGCTDNEIIGCRFYGNASFDMATQANASGGGAGIFLRSLIKGCQFMEDTKAVYVDLNAASFAGGDVALNSGLMTENNFASTVALTNVIINITGTIIRFANNADTIGVVNGSAF